MVSSKYEVFKNLKMGVHLESCIIIRNPSLKLLKFFMEAGLDEIST
jgi:hypothetical protein